jgi:hypothetical protein
MLGADQPEQMTFTDRHGRIICDNDDTHGKNAPL